MKKLIFECDDRYEAEKLASMLSVQKDGTVWVTGVAAVIDKEIVVQLKDKSSHAVVLKSRQDAERLRELLSELLAGMAVVRTTDCSGSAAEVVLD